MLNYKHSTAQHSTAQHSTAQHSTAQHSTAQHSTAQHSTAQHLTSLPLLPAYFGYTPFYHHLVKYCHCLSDYTKYPFALTVNLLRQLFVSYDLSQYYLLAHLFFIRFAQSKSLREPVRLISKNLSLKSFLLLHHLSVAIMVLIGSVFNFICSFSCHFDMKKATATHFTTQLNTQNWLLISTSEKKAL